MAKPYSLTPYLRGTFYVATFVNSTGKRVTRSLGTAEHSQANLLCAGLVALREHSIASAADTPFDIPLKAAELYFGGDAPKTHAAPPVKVQAAAVRAKIKHFPADVQAKMLPVLLERDQLHSTGEMQRLELASMKRALKEKADELAALQRSVLGQAIEAGKNAPTLAEAVSLFESTMRAETTDLNAKIVLSVVRRFIDSLETPRKNVVEITADDVARFIDQDTAKATENKRATRRDATRRRVGRFINWSAKRWKYPSQMNDVAAVKRSELKREKGEIHFHTKAEVEAVLKKLPDDYWRTLVATLAYAGLQLAELVWLRTTDIKLAADGRSGKISVTTVDDGDGGQHLLKTDHRTREVNLHPTLLLPRLKSYLASEWPGKVFLFAMPASMRVMPDRERWLVSSLSTMLRGHSGGKRRKKSAGLLPKNMNAKSLRRTFGSLLMRSGKSHAEVAAAMGNTPEVVASNYANLRGGEVSVDF